MKIKSKAFVVVFCLTFLVPAISVYQFASVAGGGYTFKCYSGCAYCGCGGDWAMVFNPCCGHCINDDLWLQGLADEASTACCDLCPYD